MPIFNCKAVSLETLFGIDISSVYEGLSVFYNLEIMKTIIRIKIGMDLLRCY